MKLSKQTQDWFSKYFRYVNYVGAAMLYLQDNFLLREPLKPEHIKHRILGHWGTVPGLNFIYMHLNYLISKTRANMLLIVGPGHGAPANLANLLLDKTLHEYYKKYSADEAGTGRLLKDFSWPGGLPSHLFPGVPGSILEGGELGYSLSTAFGAALDNPDLIVPCVVGDGEAESGPLAASWHSNKFLNPKTSGAVLPILHANGYKISNPTIYGTMKNSELKTLFKGFGYDVRIVEGKGLEDMNNKMAETLELAYKRIRQIQKEARSGNKATSPHWPMIVLRTAKGWTGVKKFDNKKVEGTWRSHGIPVKDPKTNPSSLKVIEDWLSSYKILDLVDKKGRPVKDLYKYTPMGKLRMGMNKHANGGTVLQELKLPKLSKFEIKEGLRGKSDNRNTKLMGEYLRDVFLLNKKQKNFRLMCPDEVESNKLDAVFDVTGRAYMWPITKNDAHFKDDGRVMEILSEHTIQGWLEGYILTGRHGLFATYEAFAMIVASMADQYAKFLKQAFRIPWRKPVASLNYLLTSVGWRQDHNGFSHQNPGFISNLLEKHGTFCSVYLPADANTLLAVTEDCLKRKDSINIIAAGKQYMPQWLTMKEAREQVKVGLGVWEWLDPKAAKKPDAVISAAGDYQTIEAIAAIDLLRKHMPEINVRFVNISELTSLGLGDEKRPCVMCTGDFYKYFGRKIPIVFTFHGYPSTIQQIIGGHPDADRFSIHGYREEGSTTTPFNMQVLNETSRFHLAMDVIDQVAKGDSAKAKKVAKKRNTVVGIFQEKLSEHKAYIRKHGKDMLEIEQWRWEGGSEVLHSIDY
jgi:xylulose-5-phosphate/fructose-6-phosphate phosphoketolase